MISSTGRRRRRANRSLLSGLLSEVTVNIPRFLLSGLLSQVIVNICIPRFLLSGLLSEVTVNIPRFLLYTRCVDLFNVQTAMYRLHS